MTYEFLPERMALAGSPAAGCRMNEGNGMPIGKNDPVDKNYDLDNQALP
jgi:hypothetical protein